MKASANDSTCQKEEKEKSVQGYDLYHANSYELVSDEEPFHNKDLFSSSWCVRNEVTCKRSSKVTSKCREESTSNDNYS